MNKFIIKMISAVDELDLPQKMVDDLGLDSVGSVWLYEMMVMLPEFKKSIDAYGISSDELIMKIKELHPEKTKEVDDFLSSKQKEYSFGISIDDLHNKWMKDPEYKKEYEMLDKEFSQLRTIIRKNKMN